MQSKKAPATASVNPPAPDVHSKERSRLKRRVALTEKEVLKAAASMKTLSKLIKPNLDGMDKFVDAVNTWRNTQKENKTATQDLAAFNKRHPLKTTKPSPRKA